MINLDEIKFSILKVLKNDPKKIPLKILMHKVFQDLKNSSKKEKIFISNENFMSAAEDLMRQHLIGKNKWNKYFIDYLDYEENGIEGEGYIEIDEVTGNGFITQKKDPNEYKKSSHFVHKKNLGNCKSGDYVRFSELKIQDKKHFSKFSLVDARVKKVLPEPN